MESRMRMPALGPLGWLLVVMLGFSTPLYADPPNFSKVFSPSTIGPGSVSTITFTIDNSGGAEPVTDLAFTDTLPAGVTLADPANASTSCTGGLITAVDGAGSVSYSGGGIGTGQTCQVRVDVTSATPGMHTNPIVTLNSSAGSSDSTAVDLTVDTGRPGFSKAFSPSVISFGGRSTLTFTIDNSLNGGTALSLGFTDDLPEGLLVADPSNLKNNCGGLASADPGTRRVSLSGSTLNAGLSCTISVDVTTEAFSIATEVSRVAFDNISGELLDGFLASSGKASATLEATTDRIHLVKAFTDDPVNPGGTVTLKFEITNLDRGITAGAIQFDDNLDGMLSGLATTGSLPSNPCGAGSTLADNAGVLEFRNGTLAAGASCNFEVTLQIPASAAADTYQNTTTAIQGDLGGMETGNTATDFLVINDAPTLTKAFSAATVGAGDAVDLEFSLTNNSTTVTTTQIGFTDVISDAIPGIAVTGGSPNIGACGAGSFLSHSVDSGGDVTISLSGGNLGPGASCNFTVNLQLPVGVPAGNYTNTTSALSALAGSEAVVGNPASDDLTVVGAPQFSKDFTDDPVAPGGAVTLEFTIDYSGGTGADATSLTFTDDVGAVLTGMVVSSADQSDICGTGSSLTGTGTGLLTFIGGNLSPGSTCTFSATLAVPAGALPGSHTNTTSSLTGMVSGLGVTANPASDSLTVTGFDFSKSFTDDPVIPGGQTTLEFTLENTSVTASATGIGFTDDLDAVLSGLQPAGALPTNPCGAGSTLVFASGDLSLAGGQLAPSTSCTFSVTLDVPGAADTGVYLNNTSSVSVDFGGSMLSLPGATDNLVVNKDLLSLAKSFTDDPAGPGETVNLEFTITNLDATNTVTGIQFDDDLNAALTGLSVSGALPSNPCGAGSTLSDMGGTLELRNGSLAGGGDCTFSVSLTVPGSAVLGSVNTNTTTEVTGTVSALNVRGDAASDDLKIKGVTLSKSFDGSSAASGTAVLTFTIQNLSATDTANSLSFSDNLDVVIPGLVATGLPLNDVCGSGSVLAGTSLVTLTGASLGPASSCNINVTVQVPAGAAPGLFLNTTSDLFSSGLSQSPPATASLVILAPPDFTKAFAPATIVIGNTSTLTFNIDGSGNVVGSTGLDFTDNLPAGMEIANPASASTTCTGGTLTAVPGSSTLSYTGGSLAAMSSCTVQADVTAGSIGVLNNTSGNLTSSLGDSGTASASLISNPISGTDGDGDGVDDTIENGAPNSGDGNNDGTVDALQPGVASLPGANGEYITLVAAAPSVLTNVALQAVPDAVPTDVSLPWGLFSLQISSLQPGGVADVSMIVHTGNLPNAAWKFGPEPANPVDHFYQFLFDGTTGGILNGNVIDFRYVDGMRGDSVLAADGIIIDPVAPAFGILKPIPTLGQWAWMLLFGLMGLLGLNVLKGMHRSR